MRCARLLSSMFAMGVLLLLAAGDASGRGENDGARVTSTTVAPWVVLIESDFAICSGSILDATHVVTAAHCTAKNGPVPPGQIKVVAGVDDLNVGADRSQRQDAEVAAMKWHPGWNPAAQDDDIGLLTLSTPLDLSGPSVAAIALDPSTKQPGIGSPVALYGWGQIADGKSDNDEHFLPERITPARDCQTGHSSILCAQTPGGTACHGDSGGGLVVRGAKPVLVGVFSRFSGPSCAAGNKNIYVDLTSPEISRWLHGKTVPTLAPRAKQPLMLSDSFDGVLTCHQPAWTGKPHTTLELLDLTNHTVLTRTPTYRPAARQIGHLIECLVTARNSGGTTYANSGPLKITQAAATK